MAGEVEAVRQVDPRRDVEQRAAGPVQVLNPIYRLPERLRVQRSAVTDAAIVRDGEVVAPVLHGYDPGARDVLRA